jgi:4-hydroxy-tetrahydrodipicolinate synthase
MDIKKYQGSCVALVTPFTDDDKLDKSALKQLCDWHIQESTNVILVAGTTGESATLSHSEHQELIDITLAHVNRRIPILCGTGSNSTSEAISLTQYAEKAGGDAILSVAPYYNKPTQEGFYQHYKAIAESTDLPIILYNVPGRTGSNINAETTLRLAEIPNIIGIKEASGDLAQIMEILRNRPDHFLVLSGDDAITFTMMALGGNGVISVVANQAPKMVHDMVHFALNGQWDKARELHYRLLPLMQGNFMETNPIPVKTAVAMMGKIKENFRLPLVKLSEQNKPKLQTLLKDLNLI